MPRWARSTSWSAFCKQLDDDVLHVLAHVAGLGEGGGVGDGEGHVQDARQGLREQGFARARGAEEQDVRLLELHVARGDLGVDALVVIVDRDREDLLRAVLTDDVLVEDGLNLGGFGEGLAARYGLFAVHFLGDDVVAQTDALVADVNGGASDELLDLFLRFSAERTLKISVSVVPSSIHSVTRSARGVSTPGHPLPKYTVRAAANVFCLRNAGGW
jgi:hypothetical protein